MVQVGSPPVNVNATEVEELKRKTSNFVFWHQTRLLILILSLTCMTLVQINSQIYTFTVICMDDVLEEHRLLNHTEHHWIEGSSEKSILFSATAVGALAGLIPSVPLLHNLGVRNILTLCGFFSLFGTLFFPLAVEVHFIAVIFCRFLQGLGVSILLTLVGVIPNTWSPISESSTYLAILSSVWQLSNIILMPVSGVLCDSFLGWRSIYYVFGAATLLSFALFYWLYADIPSMHKNVSNKELGKITDGKIAHVKEPVPYRRLCTDRCVLIAWLGFFGGNIGFITLLLYGPTYLREVLHFDVRSTGLANALPYILCAIYKFVAGKLSDKISMTERTKFTVWMISSVIGLTIGYAVMASTSDRLVAQIAFTLAIVLSGLIIMGAIRCLQLRCRQHTHFAVAIIALISYIVQILGPVLVGVICPDNSPEQWSLLFIIISVIMIVTNIPFPFLTTAEPADYTINSPKLEKKISTISC